MRRNASRYALWALAVAALATTAPAELTGTSIPFAPHGDSVDGSIGAPLALSATSCIVPSAGVDNNDGTADDVMLLMTGIGDTAVVTALATPRLSEWSGHAARLSATRVVVTGGGADGLWPTGPDASESTDDVVHLLDRLGSGNDVTSIVVGSLTQNDSGSPTRLSTYTIVLATRGPDTATGTADDTVALITDLGGTNTVTHLAAPFLNNRGRSQPVALTPTSFLVASDGPDGEESTADDVTYFFTDAGGANTRTDLATPFLQGRSPGAAVRLSATRAVCVGTGPDGSTETEDDQVILMDDLGGTNTITAITLPYLDNYGATVPVRMTDSSILVQTVGPDVDDETADDTIALISDLGGTNTITHISVGAMDEDPECRPVRINDTTFIVGTYGPDLNQETADDTVAVVTDVGGTNTVVQVTIPGLLNGATSIPARIDGTSVLISTGGADGDNGGGDDVLVLLSGLGVGTPVVETLARVGDYDDDTSFAQAPVVLGQGRAVLVDTGPDDSSESGGDDILRVVEGLPGTPGADPTAAPTGFIVAKAVVKFKSTKPEKGEKIAVKGTLLVDAAEFFSDDITVSVGNASQTIAASLFVEKKGNWSYSDKKGVNGWVTKLSWKAKKGTLSIKAKGVGTGAETTDASYVPVSLESGALVFGDAFAAAEGKSGLKYKAPK